MSFQRHDTPVLSYGIPSPQVSEGDLLTRERLLIERVAKVTASASTLEAVLDEMFRDVAPVLSCDRIGVAFLDARGEHLVAAHVVASYAPLRIDRGYRARLEGSSLAQVIVRGVPRVIGDLEQYLAEHPDSESSRLAFDEGVRSSLTCPLVVDEQPVGVLFLSSMRAWAFGELEVRLVQALLDRVARSLLAAWRRGRGRATVGGPAAGRPGDGGALKGTLTALMDDALALRAGRLGPVTDGQAERLDQIVFRAMSVLGLLDA